MVLTESESSIVGNTNDAVTGFDKLNVLNRLPYPPWANADDNQRLDVHQWTPVSLPTMTRCSTGI
jgi:hypothetical protein